MGAADALLAIDKFKTPVPLRDLLGRLTSRLELAQGDLDRRAVNLGALAGSIIAASATSAASESRIPASLRTIWESAANGDGSP